MKTNFAFSIIILLLSACTVPAEQYETVQTEKILLQQKVDSLQAVIIELQRPPSALLKDAELQLKTGEYTDAKQTLRRITITISPQEKKEASKLLNIVNSKLEDLAYSSIINSKDAEAYNNFIRDYPKSRYSKRIKNKFKAILSPVASSNSSNRVSEPKTSLNISPDISPVLHSSGNETNNWNTSGSTQHAKRSNKPVNYTVRVGAICSDGSRSYATGRGACSHHGRVSKWLYQ